VLTAGECLGCVASTTRETEPVGQQPHGPRGRYCMRVVPSEFEGALVERQPRGTHYGRARSGIDTVGVPEPGDLE
jgi:hypothetical protein